MQIVGKKCRGCGSRLVSDVGSIACKACEIVFCSQCLDKAAECPDCEAKIKKSADRFLQPSMDIEGSGKISEPSVRIYNKIFTESEYVIARRHNGFRWMLSMLVGIPVFIICFVLSGYIAFIPTFAALSGVYGIATMLFPGSKKHGSALYRKYAEMRGLERVRNKI